MTRKYIDYTCGTVETLINRLPFETYLGNIRGIDDDSDAMDELAELAQAAGEIAQKHGASEIRKALGDVIDDLERELVDAIQERDHYQRRAADLEERVVKLERELARCEYVQP